MEGGMWSDDKQLVPKRADRKPFVMSKKAALATGLINV